uniref:non-specific serine/threonine protein kinase n=1 Tax=Kalanchoe fedtschenkoi TaxID=63787 RepID=A0A7N0R855_KALFE
MGNCWRGCKQVGSHHSPVHTFPSSPEYRSAPNGDSKRHSAVERSVSTSDPAASARGGERRKAPEKSISGGGGDSISSSLKAFTLAELKSATRNFRPDSMLGVGGFGSVFKGWIDENTLAPSRTGFGVPVAVKKSSNDSSQGLLEWQAEVRFLGKFTHPNLVKLVGYCWEDRQYLLVYEYMPKGSLESHLFRKGMEPLSWEVRMKIAIGAAKGLAFLHTSEKKVIYRDFKASNILLDGDYNAKLSDFGLAKFGPVDGYSHVTTRVMGTHGYAAPEYLATGHLYVRSDVYGFGVVLLEMLTGLRAVDTNRPSGQHNLVEWAKPCLSDKKKLRKIIDPRLGNDQYPQKGALLLSQMVLKCLDHDIKNRPSMEDVLERLEQVDLMTVRQKEFETSPFYHKSDVGEGGNHLSRGVAVNGGGSRAAGGGQGWPLASGQRAC